MFELLMVALFVGYPIVGGWLLFAKGWPVRAGLSTLIIALLPALWLLTLPSEEVRAPGTGILITLLLVPIASSILLTVVGVLVATFKHARRVRSH